MKYRCGNSSFCAMMMLIVIVAITTTVNAKPAEERECDPYAYCEGTNFPAEVMLTARAIRCDQAPTPRDRCCLPQAKHFVCYGITVDGQYLNYDTENNARTTDFTGLCSAMARLSGKTTGKYSSALIVSGGGHLVWRYGVWTKIEAGVQRIRNLACEIID